MLSAILYQHVSSWQHLLEDLLLETCNCGVIKYLHQMVEIGMLKGLCRDHFVVYKQRY
jgi:hypothetical protein